MPHGLAPAAQIGYGQAAGDHNRARSKPRTTGNGASRFAISFKKDDETGELILVKTKS